MGDGQACGLQRMPVQPRGWATVDATSVGGPKYLEQVSVPSWRVTFKSGSPKGDIVVRKDKSLDSEEVAVLFYDAKVEQAGPQETLEDGIIRMPVSFNDGSGRGRLKQGWVTCDASAQGGPKFFETCEASRGGDGDDLGGAAGNWDKNRMWRVVNLSSNDGRALPVVNKVEPYAPGTRAAPEDIVIKWLHNGDILEQVGHSKKVKGYMVMPVKLTSKDAADVEGWVTRRLVDKSRDSESASWLEEIKDGPVRDNRKKH